MKKSSCPFLLLIFFAAQCALLQAQIKPLGNYQFTTTLPASEAGIAKSSGGSGNLDIRKGRYVQVVRSEGGTVFFKYWPFKDSQTKQKFYGTDDTPFVYQMPTEDFERFSRPIYPKFKGYDVGVYTVPFRLRGIGKGGEDFDFESSLSLQANFIAGWGNRFEPASKFDLSVGIGLTKIELGKTNSNFDEDRTASAYTMSLGGVWKPMPFANLGFFVGWDWLGAKDKEAGWKYNGKTWLGLGINIAFKSQREVENKGEAKDQNGK